MIVERLWIQLKTAESRGTARLRTSGAPVPSTVIREAAACGAGEEDEVGVAQPRAIESVEEPDHAVMQITMIRGAIVWAILSAALVMLLYGQNWGAAATAIAGFALFPWVRASARARRGTVRLDAEGIHRLKPLGWFVPWEDVATADVRKHENTSLLIVTPHTPVRHWSRTWRRGIGLPDGCYMATVYPELHNDIERYIAGRLNREPILIDLPERPELATPAIRARGPLRVLSADPPAMRTALMWGLGTAAAVAVLAFGMWKWNLGIVAVGGLAALATSFPFSQALSTRRSDITIDDEGIHRLGGWGWWYEWEEITSAAVAEHDGVTYLVVTPSKDASRPNRSRGLLPSSVAPPHAVAARVDEMAIERVRAHLTDRTFGGN